MPEQDFRNDQAARLREIAEKVCTPPTRRRPFVITVSSGKGGVGKSMIALNLAVLLSSNGKSVLLFDGDITLGNIDIMLGSVPRFTAAHVLRDGMDIEDVVTHPFPGLALLSSGGADDPIELSIPDQSRLLERMCTLEDQVDVVVIDTPAGLNNVIVAYSLFADATLAVTTCEPTAIMDAYALIKAVSREKSNHPIGVIMNAVRVPREGDEAMEKLARAVTHFLSRTVDSAGFIPFDDHVSKAVIRQQPLVQAFPRSGAALSLASISQRLMSSLLQSNMSSERRPTAIV
ncbi:MAG: MinD/ParA family protein [Ignavibacteria bacterium]|nr:MinD/ParA family protein [Ignavibacteria bacterium]